MKLTFENLGTNTYLVYEVNEVDEMDSMSLGMLTNNAIPGFAAASFMQMDTTKYIKYNVSAKVSVKQLFTGPVNKKRLIGVFSGVVNAMLNAEEYMIDPQSIILDLDYIFADVSTCETELICLPVMNVQQENQSLEMFFKNILFTTQFDQTENCDHVAQLINYLNGNPGLSLVDFKALLDQLSGAVPAPQQVQQPTAQSVPQPVQQAAPQSEPKPQSAPQPVKPVTPVAQQMPAQQNRIVPPAPQVPPVPPVPPVKPAQKAVVPPVASGIPRAPQVPQGEKPMSLLYLMQHYNKENAAIYKAQQEAAKSKKAAPVAAPTPAKPLGKAPAAGFAVPGQQPVKPVAPIPPVSQQKTVAPVQPPVPQPIPQPVQPVQPVQPAAPAGMSLNFGETTVLGQKIGETTVLGGSMQEQVKAEPYLVRSKNNEKIPLNKPVFRIGKEKSYVDYFISDNTAVSRSHANIISRDGEYFVVDTNSTNHTYVNGGMIHSNEETKLSHGTKLRFANEEFEFKLY